jgi:hypothetical protein
MDTTSASCWRCSIRWVGCLGLGDRTDILTHANAHATPEANQLAQLARHPFLPPQREGSQPIAPEQALLYLDDTAPVKADHLRHGLSVLLDNPQASQVIVLFAVMDESISWLKIVLFAVDG